MELRHLRYLCAVADHGTFSEAGRQLHISQSAISEQIAISSVRSAVRSRSHLKPHAPYSAGPALSRRSPQNPQSPQTAPLEITQRSLLGQVGSLSIGFFLWGAGGFFARIIRDYRKLHPDIKLSLHEMRTPEQMEALTTGKIDVAFARPLEPPFDRTLRGELLYRDPVVVVLPRDHPLAGNPSLSMLWPPSASSSAIGR